MHRCGDSGGKSWNGEPCRKRVGKGKLCRAHRDNAIENEIEIYKRVLASMALEPGKAVKDICAAEGISYHTFFGKLQYVPELSAAYEQIKATRDKAREQEFKETYFSFLFSPNATAADRKFFAQTQFGYREPPTRLEIKHQDNELLAGFLGVAPEEVESLFAELENDSN